MRARSPGSRMSEVEITHAGVSLAVSSFRDHVEVGAGLRMKERRTPLSYEHEETIAAFDREREEAHELHRRLHEIIDNARRNDRIVEQDHHDRDR